jgi:hypothetical protein
MLFPDVNEQLELSFFVCVTSTLRSSSICIHSFRKKVFPSTAFKTYVQFKQTILYMTRSNSELQIEAIFSTRVSYEHYISHWLNKDNI